MKVSAHGVQARFAKAAAAVVWCMGILAPPSSAETRWRLPNLVPRAIDRASLTVQDVDGTPHRLLRFDAVLANEGPGPLEFVASDPETVDDQHVMTSVRQRLYRNADRTGKSTELPQVPGQSVHFETASTHRHWHLLKAARYELLDPWGRRAAEPSPKEDAGFCLTDDMPFSSIAPHEPLYPFSFNQGCAHEDPAAAEVVMGVTPGWVDFYAFDLDYQWIDVSDTIPGDYDVRITPDPLNRIAEADELDNVDPSADTRVTIPGYRALPGAADVLPLVPSTLALGYETVRPSEPPDTLGPTEFVITQSPHHGRLNHEPGDAFSSADVTYTPEPGFTGTDAFDFVVRDARRREFPRQPTQGTVDLTVGPRM